MRSGTGLVGAEPLDGHDFLLLGEEAGGLDVIVEEEPDERGRGNGDDTSKEIESLPSLEASVNMAAEESA